MNILEHYIIEVHDVTEYTAVPGMIKVDVTYDCWGNVQRCTHITSRALWEEALSKGYFLA